MDETLSPTCNDVYIDGFDFCCIHDYSACYGTHRCRYKPRTTVLTPVSQELPPELVAADAAYAARVKPSAKPLTLVSNPIFAKHNRRHSGHVLYPVWRDMCNACYHPANSHYPQVGGKNIRVCDAWHDITNFFRDFPNYRPSQRWKFIRRDLSQDFSPANCDFEQ